MATNGTWTTDKVGHFVKFEPTRPICKYKYASEWPENIIKIFLTDKRIKRILVLKGDLNGKRHHQALVLFLDREYNCLTSKQKGKTDSDVGSSCNIIGLF